MSNIQQGQAWYTTLRPNQMHVAIALADYADDDGLLWPSIANIGEKTGYSRRQTQRLVRELERIGYVEVTKPGTGSSAPHYHLHPEALTKKPRTTAPTVDKRRGVKMTPPQDIHRGDNLTPQGVTPPTPRGDTDGTLNHQEPSEEAAAALLDPGFGDFLAAEAQLEVASRQAKGIEVMHPKGLALHLVRSADFQTATAERWGHRNCEECHGKGEVLVYSPGNGGSWVPCTAEVT